MARFDDAPSHVAWEALTVAMRLLHALPPSKLQELTESDHYPGEDPLEEVGIQIVEIMIRNRKRKVRKCAKPTHFALHTTENPNPIGSPWGSDPVNPLPIQATITITED